MCSCVNICFFGGKNPWSQKGASDPLEVVMSCTMWVVEQDVLFTVMEEAISSTSVSPFLTSGWEGNRTHGLTLLSHFRRLLSPTAQLSSRIFHAGCIWCKRTSTPDDYTSVNTPNDPRVPVSLFKCTCCSSIRVRARGGQTWYSLLRLQPQPYRYEVRNSH